MDKPPWLLRRRRGAQNWRANIAAKASTRRSDLSLVSKIADEPASCRVRPSRASPTSSINPHPCEMLCFRDAQQRHEITHQSAPTLLQLGARACTHCATAKARCSGETPCLRCRGRNLECVYPDVRNAVSIRQRAVDQDTSAGATTRLASYVPQVSQQYTMDTASGITTDVALGDADFWDLNSLSNANWLDGLAENDLTDFSLFGLPSPLPRGTAQRIDPTVWTLSSTTSPHITPDTVPTTDGAVPQARRSLPPSPTHSENPVEDVECDEEPIQTGRLYVDGDAARLSRSKRRKLSVVRSTRPRSAGGSFSLAFEISEDLPASVRHHVQDSVYAKLEELYDQLCLEPGHLWPSFERVGLPLPVIFEYLLHLYFKDFDRVLPFLDYVELTDSPDSPFLVLSMAAIGSFYLRETSATPHFAVSMQEFMRRVLESYGSGNSQSADKYIGHSRVLHLVGLAYCGDADLSRYSLEQGHVFSNTFLRTRQKINSSMNQRSSEHFATIEEQWKVWRVQESAVRLACTTWLLDCMRQYHLQVTTVLGSHGTALPLPSHEKLWNARSPQEWMDLKRDVPTITPTLREALAELYIDKRLSRGTGEFARIIIIHGLFHRLWDVERYYSDPLSSWEPIAKRQASSDILSRSPIWLPAIPAFTKWQNSTCDALDILHWQANATIARASGLEHPTVLHLHVARLVLLAPLTSLIHFAQAQAAGSAVQASDREIIRRWAIHHQYKARLSIVHAGVVFWHVRRYSVNGFYEAPAVALAALTLWAFGTFAIGRKLAISGSIPSTRRQSPQPGAPDAIDDAECTIILIDRPTDDELVQQFIKHGSTMRIHLSGVGDLYENQGPKRVLLQGCKLLNTLKCWGIGDTWLDLLKKFADVSGT
nr:hypothetical protein CFP56_03064 [Quercus suber]